MQRVWYYEGRSADNLDLTGVLSAAAAYLPPDGNQWFLKVYDRYTGDEGQITEFSITYDGTTYASTDPPVPITDLMTSYAYIPNL